MFLAAPFLHVHQSGRHEQDRLGSHDHETVIHAHVPEALDAHHGRESEEANLSHGDHDAKPVTIFLTLQAKYLAPPFAGLQIESEVRLAPNPAVVATVLSEDHPSAHDPPHLDLTIPRAPPV